MSQGAFLPTLRMAIVMVNEPIEIRQQKLHVFQDILFKVWPQHPELSRLDKKPGAIMLNSVEKENKDKSLESITLRPGSAEDSYNIFLLFEESLADLVRRMGSSETTSFSDPDTLARMWEERRPLPSISPVLLLAKT